MGSHWSHSPEAKAKISAAARARWASVTIEDRKAAQTARYKAWVEKNQERSKEIKREWYLRNREEINRKQREKNKTPERKEFMRVYAPKHRAENREKYSAYTNTRRARKRGAEGSHSNEEWKRLLESYHGMCAYCGNKKATHRDHVIPLSRGGSNYIGNIVPTCVSCNSSKGTMTGEEYRARLCFPKE